MCHLTYLLTGHVKYSKETETTEQSDSYIYRVTQKFSTFFSVRLKFSGNPDVPAAGTHSSDRYTGASPLRQR